MMKWITISDESDLAAKTKRFRVCALDCTSLGIIRFYPRWRKYAFYPNNDTLYESDCRIDIAEFCKAETAKWREGLKR
jgi:hypothetical protein